jgi:long-chain fatty acid transport protein
MTWFLPLRIVQTKGVRATLPPSSMLALVPVMKAPRRIGLRKACLRAGVLATGVLLGFLGGEKDADASGYLTARFGADHGTPAHPNAFAVYFNPAALGGTQGTTITGDVGVLLRFARYNRTGDALSPSNDSLRSDQRYIDANTGVANLTNLLALPFVGFNSDFGTKNFRAGWAFYIPFGGLATWDRRAGIPGVPGTTDGVQRWHSISGQILAIYNTFAFAYKFGKSNFSIGASVSPIYHNVATARARNADGSDDTVTNGNLVEGRSLLEAHGIDVALSGGIYWEPMPEKLRLGLSYIGQPGITGGTRMSGELRTQLGGNQESKSNVDFLQNYPDVIRFGTAFKATRSLELRGDFEFVRWSLFRRQCVVEKGADCAVGADGGRLAGPEGDKVQLNVVRNWDNAIGVRVGPGFWVNDDLETFGSVGFTTPAVPKETIDAVTIDSQRLYLTMGAKYSFSKHFSLAGSYNHIYFFPVNTNGQNDQNISAHPSSAPGGGAYNVSRSPSADGRYRSQIGFININAAYTF